MKNIKADIAIIGAGSGGLSVAAGAAQLGLKVVLFERGEMGGDCLNTGCVPSKALIAAGKRAQALRTAAQFGVAAIAPQIDWAAVKAHVHGVIATIAPVDSQERFEGFGVTVVREHARFTGRRTLASDSVSVTARKMIIAAGGRASAPPIPGLAGVPYLTNETIFTAPDFPQKLIVLGAGPIGIELGQAFARLGAQVVIVEAAQALARFDAEVAQVALHALAQEGVRILAGAKASAARAVAGGVELDVTRADGATETLAGSHLLVAAGRTPNTDGLDLDKAGVAFDRSGVKTDAYLRTTNPAIYAVGDIAGKEQLTHAAGWHASALVRTLLFRAATRADSLPMPAAVYCEPEVAQVGLTLAQAQALHGAKAKAVRWTFEENDRAQAERSAEGLVKLVIGPGGAILGGAAAGEGVGDMIGIVGFCIANNLKVRALTNWIAPYPTRIEALKRAAGAVYTPVLFSPRTRRLVSLLWKLP